MDRAILNPAVRPRRAGPLRRLTRVAGLGVLVGALVGLGCTCWFQQAGGNEFLYAFVGLVPTMVIGYSTSFLRPRPDASHIQGLTFWTRTSIK